MWVALVIIIAATFAPIWVEWLLSLVGRATNALPWLMFFTFPAGVIAAFIWLIVAIVVLWRSPGLPDQKSPYADAPCPAKCQSCGREYWSSSPSGKIATCPNCPMSEKELDDLIEALEKEKSK